MDYKFHWPVLIEYRHLLLSGLALTLKLSALGFILSTVLGIGLGLARLSTHAAVRALATAYVEFFRNVPLVVQIFFFYFGLGLGSFAAGLLALVLYSSAFIGEVIRSGVSSIPRTQHEAAYASGLSTPQVIRYVILPQAVVIVIPPLGTEFVNLVKNSAIALTVGVPELTFMTQEIDSLSFRGFEAATAATAVYATLCLSILGVLHLFERAFKMESKLY